MNRKRENSRGMASRIGHNILTATLRSNIRCCIQVLEIAERGLFDKWCELSVAGVAMKAFCSFLASFLLLFLVFRFRFVLCLFSSSKCCLKSRVSWRSILAVSQVVTVSANNGCKTLSNYTCCCAWCTACTLRIKHCTFVMFSERNCVIYLARRKPEQYTSHFMSHAAVTLVFTITNNASRWCGYRHLKQHQRSRSCLQNVRIWCVRNSNCCTVESFCDILS